MRFFMIGLSILFILTGGRRYAASAAVLITGQVVNEATGAPISDAAVSLIPTAESPNSGVNTRTSVNGTFILKAPHPGRYGLKVDAPEYVLLDRPVEAPAAGVSSLRLSLRRPPTVRVRVLGPDGAPVTTGDISLWLLTARKLPGQDASASWAHGPAGLDGIVEISAVRTLIPRDAGAIAVAARVPGLGYARAFRPEWPNESVTLQLVHGSAISGTVTDANGKPVTGGTIHASGADLDLGLRFLQGAPRAALGAGGMFTIPGFPPGRYDLGFTAGATNRRFHLLTLGSEPASVALGIADRADIPLGFSHGQDLGDSGSMDMHIWGPLAETQTAGITVTGRVLTSGTNAPLPGMAVALSDLHYPDWWGSPPVDAVVADGDGQYRLAAPRPGHYRLGTGLYQNNLYNPANRELDVPPGGTTADLVVTVRPIIRVSLLGKDGRPITSGFVSVSINVQVGSGGYGTNTNREIGPDGLVSAQFYNQFDTNSIRDMKLSVRHPTAGWASVEIPKWPTEPVTVRLQPGATLSGRVLDAEGTPVKLANLQIDWLSDNNPLVDFQTVASVSVTDGHFEVAQLPAGAYRLTITTASGQRETQIISLAPAANQPLTIRMPQGLSLSVHVVNAQGHPVVATSFGVFQYAVERGEFPQFQQMNPPEGPEGPDLKLTGLTPGLYCVTAQLNGGGSASGLVTLLPGKDGSLILQPQAQRSVVLTILNAAGKPAPGAEVAAFWISDRPQSPAVEDAGTGTTDTEGKYVLSVAHPGSYLIRVTIAGTEIRIHHITVGPTPTALTLRPDNHL